MSITPLMPVYPRCGVRPVRGEHCHLIDEDGTRYLDFAAGIAKHARKLTRSPASGPSATSTMVPAATRTASSKLCRSFPGDREARKAPVHGTGEL